MTISYAYDAAGRRSSTVDGAGTTSWTYDALNRLTQASYPGGDVTGYGYDAVGSTTYSYDANGNQTGKTVSGTTTNYAWDPTGIGHVSTGGRESTWAAREILDADAVESSWRAGRPRSRLVVGDRVVLIR